jgi:shikimate dehydrogenase
VTRLLVLLGDPVAHSLSPRLQNAAFRAAGVDGVYLPLRVGGDDLAGLLRGIARAGGGGNVTLPHKERAHDAVEVRSPAAHRTGAVNTFWLEDGRIHGDNTDVEGFVVAHGALAPPPGPILVLGAGGAARAVLAGLSLLPAEARGPVTLWNRSPRRAVELVVRFAEPGTSGDEPLPVSAAEGPAPPAHPWSLVVNATSLGLREEDPLPLDPGLLSPDAAVLDLVYRPGRTRWVRAAAERGLRSADGTTMLAAQGRAAFRRWWGFDPPEDAYASALAGVTAEPPR